MRALGAFTALAVLVLVSGCTDEADEPTAPTPAALAESVEIDALTGHLTALQSIADAHDGNRAAGTAGYDASVDYVAGQLTDAGFDVQTPEFSFDTYDVRDERVSVDGRDVQSSVIQFSPATPAGGVRARVVALPTEDGPGCQGTDYDGLDATGAVVVVARGECSFADKQRLAAERGAVAVVVTNVDDRPAAGATLGASDAGRVPTVLVGRSDGEAAAAAGEIVVVVDASTSTTTTRNVIAQTKTGSADDVVLVGGHLDSVPAGPGINDNGTGVAAVLETARQLGAAPDITNAVRFAFWGAEELGLLGSDAYVTGLDRDARLDIALYLNYDMLGSPNFGYFAYDGDNSDNEGEPAGPQGSAGIERTMGSYLLASGVTPLGTDFDGRSDYGSFIAHGIPAGGTDTGADDRKTEAEVAMWGGTAGETFDPNYHTDRDRLDNVNRDAFEMNAETVAFATATYANSIEGPNGVPGRAEREQVRGDAA
ncbi:MAG TPA: M28 family metallopeptidase [Aldersonia sp.]